MSKHHKVFVSYHHENDEGYKNQFERLVGDIYISKSVDIGDIKPNLKTETIRRKIRDEFLRDSTVTVVLIGRETWKRKHVDWEIGSSIQHTRLNPRSGLLGIFLRDHPDYDRHKYNPYITPPRLHCNAKCGYATLHHWSDDPSVVANWIHEAFEKRFKVEPDNSYPSFTYNRTGERWYA